MRLTGMTRLRLLSASLVLGLALPLAAPVSASAQQAVPAGSGNNFKDTSMIKPPAGSRVAIYEFEDLECPACARAHPMVVQAIDHYKVAFVRKDFPLPGHIWSTDAAIWARYMQDKISPKIADEYRTAVFAAQATIASKDDLMAFNRRFFQSHGGSMPFLVDPTGQFRREVFEDKAVGEKMGLTQTPTIFVCTQNNWVQVTDPTKLYQTIEAVQSQLSSTATPVKKPTR